VKVVVRCLERFSATLSHRSPEAILPTQSASNKAYCCGQGDWEGGVLASWSAEVLL
jgi:hypothetical protein